MHRIRNFQQRLSIEHPRYSDALYLSKTLVSKERVAQECVFVTQDYKDMTNYKQALLALLLLRNKRLPIPWRGEPRRTALLSYFQD